MYVGAYECKGSDYISYTSIFGCYNPNTYDGHENYDVYDEILKWDRSGQPTYFQRTYYYSKDGSCQNQIENVFDKSSLGACITSSGDNYAISVQDTLTFSDIAR